MEISIRILFMIVLLLIVAAMLLAFISTLGGQGSDIISNLYNLFGLKKA